jgi:hypothetical protein
METIEAKVLNAINCRKTQILGARNIELRQDPEPVMNDRTALSRQYLPICTD